MEPEGRLSFPKPIPATVAASPLCMAAGDLNADGRTDLVYVSSVQRERSLHVLLQDAAGGLAPGEPIQIADARTDPDGIMVINGNFGANEPVRFEMHSNNAGDVNVDVPYKAIWRELE